MVRVLVVGVGRMGFAHAKAANELPDVEIVGLVARDWQKWQEVAEYFPEVPLYNTYNDALAETEPDAVIISSYTDTHAHYACQAMEAGAHVFVEKPLAMNKREAGHTIAMARKCGKKLYIGYILRHHDKWQKFIDCAKSLTPPVNVTITSNQHSTGEEWQQHKNILDAGLSPLVDCGIHYADVMAQITSEPIEDIKSFGYKTVENMLVPNETNMLITYGDGSKLYFESGFGPNIGKEDIPIAKAENKSSIVQITADNVVITADQHFQFSDDETDKAILAQQKAFFNAIKEDMDLEDHWHYTAMSLAVVLIAEEEMKIS